MDNAFSLDSLSEVFGEAPVYIEVKVKSYGKPNKEMLHSFINNKKNFVLNRDLFITSMTTNESSNEEDTRYSTELRFTEGVHKHT